jgi:lipopolysaccharide/colanic/teichoic acid biosynthesis glycosyltransferase
VSKSRVVDIGIASLVLLVLAPVMVLIAGRIALDRSGSVFYRQQRVGRGGSPITIHKFRTLRASADDAVEVAPDDDPRITRPGRWLRRWRLDELPQLIDVLLGRMALVGPRPETAGNLIYVPAELTAQLHAVRPGLTSDVAMRFLAEDQVLAGQADPLGVYRRVFVPAKVAEDVRALSHRSLFGDLKILVRTPVEVLSAASWAHSRKHLEALIDRD